MDINDLIAITIIEEHVCGFRHALVRPCPEIHRDDAMNRRCNRCEHIVRQCICEWGVSQVKQVL